MRVYVICTGGHSQTSDYNYLVVSHPPSGHVLAYGHNPLFNLKMTMLILTQQAINISWKQEMRLENISSNFASQPSPYDNGRASPGWRI